MPVFSQLTTYGKVFYDLSLKMGTMTYSQDIRCTILRISVCDEPDCSNCPYYDGIGYVGSEIYCAVFYVVRTAAEIIKINHLCVCMYVYNS